MSTKLQRRQATQSRIKAMAHPLRGEMLRLLLEKGPASPVQLGRQLEEKTENVSFHMKKLVEFDCAELVEERPVRGAVEHIYRATERALVSTEEWDELGPAERQWFVSEIFQGTVDDVVASEKAQLIGSEKELHLTRTHHLLDDEGLQEGLEIFEAARLAMIEVEQRCAARVNGGADDRFKTSSNIGLFKIPRHH